MTNNKFGRDERSGGYRHRNEDYPRGRDAREPYWRGSDEDRGWRSPDQEFESSANYREPHGEIYAGPAARSYERSRYEGRYAGSYPGFGSDVIRGGYAGRGPKGYARDDQRIREDVCDRLSWNDEVDATEIIVRVENGEVSLEGSVQTRHMKRLAEDIAEAVTGVQDVHNTLRVQKPMLTELKEKLTGEQADEHYANTGTRSATTAGAAGARNGVSG